MSATTQQTADRVRGISLRELLCWHGFEIRQEGISFRARSDHYNIVVTGNKWFDNKAGVGGAGAIDLQMHLCGGDFQTTCHVLAEGFRPRGTGLVFPSGKGSESRRKPFEELAARYAVPSTMNWNAARNYLVETRRIEPAIVDELHERGSIYANNHQPNPGIVFLHRTMHGKVEGATLRDTRHETNFRPTLGNKLTAWFAVGDLTNADTVVAVESPIDALSYYTLFAGRNGRIAVASCSGSTVPGELMAQSHDRRQSFVVALPYGRLLKCELVNTVDSTNIDTPIIGLITEDVCHDGRLIIPAGTEVHGIAQKTAARERIGSERKWILVFQDGREMPVSGAVLDYAPDGSNPDKWGETDGSAGLRGYMVAADKYAEAKAMLAAMISSGAGAFPETTNLISPLTGGATQIQNGGWTNAISAGIQAGGQIYSQRLLESLQKDPYFVRVPAGTLFYLYVTQTLDLAKAGAGLSAANSTNYAQ